ncbi:MAG: DUF4215 domain-containing protein [Myxococcales bacterium]|nr:DUF4215 domain-containing protein [Myxococcales bacterium]
MCGDGQVDMGEECDDGENNGDDKACTSECQSNVCGDGYVLAGVEECDDGNISNTDECVDGCKLATCGDGFIQEDKEECDDGNDVDTDTCPTSCKPASCGDGFVQQGKEECDDGNQSNTDACTNACKAAACGDGYVQGDEACDDGNTDDLDACSGDCATSRRFVFVTADVYDGNLGGLAGADALCSGLVDDARADMVPAFLAGRTFKAWLSDDTQSPDTRFSAKGEGFGGTYVMIDSTKDPVELVPVAVGWAGLVSGMLDHPLDHDQHGKLIQSNEDKAVWSNTQPDGTAGKWAMANQVDDGHCKNWGNNAVGFGNAGQADLQTGNWTANGLPSATSRRASTASKTREHRAWAPRHTLHPAAQTAASPRPRARRVFLQCHAAPPSPQAAALLASLSLPARPRLPELRLLRRRRRPRRRERVFNLIVVLLLNLDLDRRDVALSRALQADPARQAGSVPSQASPTRPSQSASEQARPPGRRDHQDDAHQRNLRGIGNGAPARPTTTASNAGCDDTARLSCVEAP